MVESVLQTFHNEYQVIYTFFSAEYMRIFVTERSEFQWIIYRKSSSSIGSNCCSISTKWKNPGEPLSAVSCIFYGGTRQNSEIVETVQGTFGDKSLSTKSRGQNAWNFRSQQIRACSEEGDRGLETTGDWKPSTVSKEWKNWACLVLRKEDWEEVGENFSDIWQVAKQRRGRICSWSSQSEEHVRMGSSYRKPDLCWKSERMS